MSPLHLQYLTKKQSVFQKISSFGEKFKGVGVNCKIQTRLEINRMLLTKTN